MSHDSTGVIINIMTHLGDARTLQFHLLAALLLVGCGGSDNGGTGTAGTGGQVTDPWRDYCTATFKSDVAIQDGFGGTAFTAHAGEQYLLTEFGTFAGQPRVQIDYLTPLGPDKYTVPVTGGADTFPFTSSCTIDNTVQYYVAFTDVTVFAAQDLAAKICEHTRGHLITARFDGGLAIQRPGSRTVLKPMISSLTRFQPSVAMLPTGSSAFPKPRFSALIPGSSRLMSC